MVKKRKQLESKSAQPSPKKQQQQQQQQQPEPEVEDKVEEEEYENLESKSAQPSPKKQQQQQQPEAEVEEVEDEVEKEESEDEDDEENADNQVPADPSTSGGAAVAADEDDEPIPSLLDPLSKDQLINLLSEAAEKHLDVADRIRKVADEDPVYRKIFVHGLSWDTNAETLTNVFKQYGEIEDCKAVCDKVSGKSKGYGFILFKTRTGSRKALKQPQKKIGNRMIACQLASIGPVASQPVAASGSAAPKMEYTQRKIYVSNVGADLDPQKLSVFFSKYGEIEEGPLGLDKMTGKPKGFCLFVYKTAEGARKALEEPHKQFEGHILHCQKAIDGPKPRKPQQQHQHQQQHSIHNPQFQRNDTTAFLGSASGTPGHLVAPSAAGIGFNQGAAAALNPSLGQALALLATQGAGLGLNNLRGLSSATGVTQGVPGAGPGIHAGYGNQTNISPGLIGAFGNQGGMQGLYPNQGGTGRGQHGAGQYGGGTRYMGQ